MQDTVPPNREQVKGPRPGIPRALVNSLADWLIQQALADAEVERLVSGCCERLLAIGVPLQRGYAAFSVLHPLHSGLGITWQRGAASRLEDYPHSPGGVNTGFTRSPQFYMMERGLEFLRIRLEPKPRHYDFPVLADLIGQGATDYVAYLVSFDGTSAYSRQAGAGMMGSWASDHAEGFSDQDIEVLLRIQPRLALACKVALRSQLMRNVSKTYLGRTTGKRVLSGQIKRGDGEAIDAAIYYADLRGSTAMADRLSRQDYIDTLNSFFDAIGQPVLENGGEILSFIGDALLAIFPIGRSVTGEDACLHAADAASAAQASVAALNHQRAAKKLEPLQFGLALHRGEVMYGNVGVPARLSFSVFGSVVNEVARLDSLTKELGEPLLASHAFVKSLPMPWRPLGHHKLRGVGRRMKVFAPTWSSYTPKIVSGGEEDEARWA
jgi:adenylate cyclase